MIEPDILEQTWQEKLLFYITAFFILLGTFSLFAFLFLVPFVIDPAFTTIFMEFDETPALCITVETEKRRGASNCTWSSCREGCTKEVYDCTQIRVNYKRATLAVLPSDSPTTDTFENDHTHIHTHMDHFEAVRSKRGIRDYDYDGEEEAMSRFDSSLSKEVMGLDLENQEFLPEVEEEGGPGGNNSEWYYKARLFPNVKGCGYPPSLNCSIFTARYMEIGTNFSCYYSKVDRGIVISDLDMWQVYMNLVYAMAIPIPSFIFSVIYLTFAYFKIYNEDEETELLEENAEAIDVDAVQEGCTPVPNANSLQPVDEVLTPGSEVFREDLASFGHQYKVAMADELSRESFAVPISNSISIPG